MGSVDRVDDRTFNVNFDSDGIGRLRDVVKEKLMEFTDFSDDHLVEYVIVLVKNGKRKEEARNELHVFLDDDTNSFVNWLWDHLASNLELYVQPQDSFMDEPPETKPTSGDQGGENDSHHSNPEAEKEKPNNLSRSRHNREWKGLVRDAVEPPPLRSSDIEKIHLEEKSSHKVSRAKRSTSPRPSIRRKRDRPDEHENKREAVSQVNIDAPRRLLQFAVRDAVATSRPSTMTKEPKLKRLRSVVSTSTGDAPLADHPQRLRSVARVVNPMATVIRAVAEAAQDVIRVKPSGSVFDRLGRGMNVSETTEQDVEFREAVVGDGEYGDMNQTREQTRLTYRQRSHYDGQYDGSNMTMLEGETVLASDSTSENEGYDDVNVGGDEGMDISETTTSAGNRGEDSLMVQYSVAKNADGLIRRNKEQDQPVVAPNTSRSKIVNISVNVNTWKPPHYQEHREVVDIDNRKSIQETDVVSGKTGVRLMKENSNPVTVGNGNAKSAVDAQKESPKTVSPAPGLYAAGRPLEDADSRTIFVSNVHFAATKDSLSRHFNKFGEVLKVIIVTDAATGQPKGSAYVEFMRKEAADNALSLDGTSFMSRILKVVRRSAAHQEAGPIMTWPRSARGSPFGTARFARAPFPRGMPGAFRVRPPIKPGARSLQWKRDAHATPAESGAPMFGNAVPSTAPRSLTYVRTEPKPDGNPGTT